MMPKLTGHSVMNALKHLRLYCNQSVSAWQVCVKYFVPALALLLAGVAAGRADDSLEIPTIKIGMSTALTGPARELGREVRAGVLAAFHETNSSGGVAGRKLELVAKDDGYEPSRTIVNMRYLVEQEHVLAILGNVGTPTAVAAIPIANSTKTPFVGAYTGAGVLRKSPPDRYVINYRASYEEETAAMVGALIEKAGLLPQEIAFFTQRDAYGDAGFSGGIRALKRFGLRDTSEIAHARYERNTNLVEKGLAELVLHRRPVKAVIMVGAYDPCAKFIKLAKQNSFTPLFLNVSFVGAGALARSLDTTGDGVIVTQVVPHPANDSVLAIRYRAALSHVSEQQAKPSHTSFEGYIAARILVKAIDQSVEDLSRENLVQALENLGEFSLDSLSDLSLSAQDHQASQKVWPTELRDSGVVPFEWSELSSVEPGIALQEGEAYE